MLNKAFATSQAIMFTSSTKGDGNDHVGFARPGVIQHIGVCTVSDNATNVGVGRYRIYQFTGYVDHRDVVVFNREPFGDAAANLACAANNDLHRAELPPCLPCPCDMAANNAASRCQKQEPRDSAGSACRLLCGDIFVLFCDGDVERPHLAVKC
jgi:hypothetical protein